MFNAWLQAHKRNLQRGYGRGMNQEMGIVRQMHKRKAGRRADDRDYGAHLALHHSVCAPRERRQPPLLPLQEAASKAQAELCSDKVLFPLQSSSTAVGDWCVGDAAVSRQLLR